MHHAFEIADELGPARARRLNVRQPGSADGVAFRAGGRGWRLHDLDGNLTQSLSTGTIAPGSGRQQTYKWDAENRLSKIEALGTPQAGDKAIAFKYDYLGRRVQAEVSTFGGSSWTVFRDAEGKGAGHSLLTCCAAIRDKILARH